MANLDLADGRFARAHALEEVAHVVVALVEADGVVGERFGEQLRLAGLDLAAVTKIQAPLSPTNFTPFGTTSSLSTIMVTPLAYLNLMKYSAAAS